MALATPLKSILFILLPFYCLKSIKFDLLMYICIRLDSVSIKKSPNDDFEALTSKEIEQLNYEKNNKYIEK